MTWSTKLSEFLHPFGGRTIVSHAGAASALAVARLRWKCDERKMVEFVIAKEWETRRSFFFAPQQWAAMRFAAVVDEAFAEVEHQYQSRREVDHAKRRIREKFRQAALCLAQREQTDLEMWPVEKVMQSIAGEALQQLAVSDWFEQINWAYVLAAFVSESGELFGRCTEEELQPVAVRVVQRWREHEKQQKQRLFGDPGKGPEQAKEPFSKRMLQGHAKVPAKTSRNAPLHLDSGYKEEGVNSMREPKGAKDACEIDIDFGFFNEVDSLGVSLQELQVESTRPNGRAVNLLMRGDVVTSVNGTKVTTDQEFWREVQHSKPGQLRVCVLPKRPTPPEARTARLQHSRPVAVAPRAEKDPGLMTGACRQPKREKGVPEVDPKAEMVTEVDLKVGILEVDPKAGSRSDKPMIVDPKAGSRSDKPMIVDPKAGSRSDKPMIVDPKAGSRSDKPMIVLNCEDIGSSFFKCSGERCSSERERQQPFPWEAVRCAIKFYEDLGFMPQPVCHQATMARHPPPERLREKLIQCPVVDDDGRQQGRGSDRIFVITLASTYDCPFVDNSNYREQVWNGHELWPWLQQEGLALKVEYIFDSFGEFLPSREVVPRAVSGTIWIPWTEYGGR
eukprot:s56_g26.t1